MDTFEVGEIKFNFMKLRSQLYIWSLPIIDVRITRMSFLFFKNMLY